MPTYVAMEPFDPQAFADVASRRERKSISEGLTRAFADRILAAFPEAKVTYLLSSIGAVILELPEDRHAELAERMKAKLGCDVRENRMYQVL